MAAHPSVIVNNMGISRQPALPQRQKCAVLHQTIIRNRDSSCYSPGVGGESLHTDSGNVPSLLVYMAF